MKSKEAEKQIKPKYFSGLKQEINRKYGKEVEVLIPDIAIKETGRNTTDLVKCTQKYNELMIDKDSEEYRYE